MQDRKADTLMTPEKRDTLLVLVVIIAVASLTGFWASDRRAYRVGDWAITTDRVTIEGPVVLHRGNVRMSLGDVGEGSVELPFSDIRSMRLMEPRPGGKHPAGG